MNIGSMLNHYASGTKFQTEKQAPKREKKVQIKSTREIEISDDNSHEGTNTERNSAVIARWKTLLDGHEFTSDEIRIIFGASVNGSWNMIKKMKSRNLIKETCEIKADGVGGRPMKKWTWA